MEFEASESANDGDAVVGSAKQKRYDTRRKIEDRAEFRKMRDELGWMDDFDTQFEEVY